MILDKKGYKLFLEYYMGRLGNNLIQITNMIYIGIMTESNVLIKSHPFINFTQLNFTDKNNNNCELNITNRFYYKSECCDIYPNNDQRHEIFQKYIYNNLNITQELKPYDLSTIVIHIRSGDIFGNNPHKGYVQPPFSYYQYIIEKHNPEKIIIVTEQDKRNPCINKIKTTYNDICEIQSNSLTKDFEIMLSAKTFITANSTLSEMISLLSKNIEILYTHRKIGIYKDIIHHNLSFRNYIEGDWKKTPKQLILMLTHNVNDIYIEVSN